MLAHFVGDLHQPLHVGAIYLDAAGTPANPDQGTFDPDTETAGGNSISEAHGNLHPDWDALSKEIRHERERGHDHRGQGSASHHWGDWFMGRHLGQ